MQLPLLHQGLRPRDSAAYPALAAWFAALERQIPGYAARVQGDVRRKAPFPSKTEQSCWISNLILCALKAPFQAKPNKVAGFQIPFYVR